MFNIIIRFADETTVVGLIRDMAVWCQDNNLYLNVSKTMELIVDDMRKRGDHTPINIKRTVVELIKQRVVRAALSITGLSARCQRNARKNCHRSQPPKP
jgi:hypothetical protein